MRRAIESGEIGIHPYGPNLVQPASLDLRLGEDFQIMDDGGPLDTRNLEPHTSLSPCKMGDQFTLFPGDFVLAQTLERVSVPASMCAKVEGKSSLGRLGLILHATAGFIDPGFEGTITLELSLASHRPLTLYPGMKIGQICFFQLTQPAEKPYGEAIGSHYQNQSGPTPSRL